MTVTDRHPMAGSIDFTAIGGVMKEKDIEQKIVRAVKSRGGICPKWTGWAGCPDRIVLFPIARIGFIEVKAPGQKPRPLQVSRHRILRGLGFKVYVIDGAEQIESVLDEIGGSDG